MVTGPGKAARAAAKAAGGTILVPSYRSAPSRGAVRAAQKSVWLTFDDGPHPTHTATALKALDRHKVRATFFVLGSNAKKHLGVVRAAFEAGHRIGNHSFSHKDMSRLGETQIRKEFEQTEEVIGPFLGKAKVFRPPYGAHNATVDRIAAELGYRLIIWNVDTLDWDRKYQPDRWVQHALEQIRRRDTNTVLAHDIHRTTAENLDLLLRKIRALGNVIFKAPSTL